MIKLYFLEWSSGCLQAGFTYNGKRHLSLVTTQNGTAYVRTGSAIKHDLTLHRLSAAQIAAAHDFLQSGQYAVEYAAPIE